MYLIYCTFASLIALPTSWIPIYVVTKSVLAFFGSFKLEFDCATILTLDKMKAGEHRVLKVRRVTLLDESIIQFSRYHLIPSNCFSKCLFPQIQHDIHDCLSMLTSPPLVRLTSRGADAVPKQFALHGSPAAAKSHKTLSKQDCPIPRSSTCSNRTVRT
jgi:hypothetical protein